MQKGKLVGVIICSVLIVGIIVLLVCNFAGAFKARAEELEPPLTETARTIDLSRCNFLFTVDAVTWITQNDYNASSNLTQEDSTLYIENDGGYLYLTLSIFNHEWFLEGDVDGGFTSENMFDDGVYWLYFADGSYKSPSPWIEDNYSGIISYTALTNSYSWRSNSIYPYSVTQTVYAAQPTSVGRYTLYNNISILLRSGSSNDIGRIDITTSQEFNVMQSAKATFQSFTYPMSTYTMQGTKYFLREEVIIINPYINGYQSGYTQGDEDGYAYGYADGKSDGYNEGYDEGYDDGEDAGWSEGYQAGLGETGKPGQAASNLIKTVWGVVNVPILGEHFTVGTLLSISVILSLVLLVLKLVRG